MKKVTVPIDMSSEQKVIFGVLSKRQLIYIIVGGATMYAYVPSVWNFTFGVDWSLAIFASFFSMLPTLAVVGILGFIRLPKYHMFVDRYLLVKLGYKNQIGTWRKGRKPAKWMEENN